MSLKVLSIATGGGHSCAVFEGGLKCWGSNFLGMLGLEDSESRGDGPGEMGDNLPFVNLGQARVVSVMPGTDSHTCALLTGGRVKCWGDNDFGQLGIEIFTDRGGRPAEMGDQLPFVNLGSGRSAQQLAAGANHTCAILDDGSLKCWGSNKNGQLGLGDVLLRGSSQGDMGDNLPAVQLGSSRVRQIAAGSVHTCALLDDAGIIKCWGWDFGFQDAPVMPDSPLAVVNLGGLVAFEVVAGGISSCASLSDGTVRCWTVPNHAYEPVQPYPPVSFGSSAAARHLGIAGGRGCALLGDASVWCWEIRSPSGAPRATQIQLGPGRSALQMATSGGRERHHGCALLDDDSVKCWGLNDQGQLGVGDATSRNGSVTEPLLAVDLGKQG